MRWISFKDGIPYTFAADIQNLAVEYGYKAPADPSGQRHPGTDCNIKARTIIKTPAMRTEFNLAADGSDVVEIYANDSIENAKCMNDLFERGFVGARVRDGAVHLYSEQMANAIVQKMVNMDNTSGVPKPRVPIKVKKVVRIPFAPDKRIHSLAKNKTKPVLSLFGRDTRGKGKEI